MARGKWVGTAAVLAAAGSAWICAAGAAGAAPAPRQLAVTPTGRVAMEVVGQSLQDGDSLVSVGYVTHVAGVSDAQLFSDPAIRDEKHARLVFSDQFDGGLAVGAADALHPDVPRHHDAALAIDSVVGLREPGELLDRAHGRRVRHARA